MSFKCNICNTELLNERIYYKHFYTRRHVMKFIRTRKLHNNTDPLEISSVICCLSEFLEENEEKIRSLARKIKQEFVAINGDFNYDEVLKKVDDYYQEDKNLIKKIKKFNVDIPEEQLDYTRKRIENTKIVKKKIIKFKEEMNLYDELIKELKNKRA